MINPLKFFSPSWWRQLAISLRWQQGRSSELRFWDRYLSSKGLRWPQEFQQRLDPNLPLSPELAGLLDPASSRPKVLDVGAGPLTVVGRRFRGMTVDLAAIDPLAAEYDILLARHQIVPPVRTIRGVGETLDRQFPPNSFDLAHARNCLDHGLDPVAAVEQMLAVVKPGGWVVLRHHPDEAIAENWRGMHQWNFSRSPEGDFIISSRSEAVNVTRKLRQCAEISCDIHNDDGELWLEVRIRKI